jgi:hypothetical protein
VSSYKVNAGMTVYAVLQCSTMQCSAQPKDASVTQHRIRMCPSHDKLQ